MVRGEPMKRRLSMFVASIAIASMCGSCASHSDQPVQRKASSAAGMERPSGVFRPNPASAQLNRDSLPPAVDRSKPQLGVPFRILRSNTAPPVEAHRDAAVFEGSDDRQATLNFLNADVRDVVRVVFDEILKLNYVIDPGVQGNVTVQTVEPIARDAVLPTLEAALRLAGIAIIKNNDGLHRIVAMREAARQSEAVRRPPAWRSSALGYGMQIVPLRYVSADDMQRILEPLAPQGSVVRVDQHRNLLVLAGTQQDLAVMLENVATFDVDWLAGMSFAMFPLRSARAKTLATELNLILGGQDSPISGLVRLISIDRMNAIVAISPRASYLREVEQWIERLDQAGATNEQRIYVYYVQNGRAADIAGVLKTLFAGERPNRPPDGISEATATVPYDPSGIVPRLGTPPAPLVPPALSDRTDQTTPRRVESLDQADTRDEGLRLGPSAQGVQITADEKNNALVVLATPREYAVIEAALQKLDIIPLQVMIEASVAEVTLTDGLRYGVQYFIREGNGQFVLSDVASGAVASQFPGFSYLFTPGSNIRAVLNMLENVTDVNVISSPQLMVLNNQTATLQVGDQVPVATQSAVSILLPGAPIVNTIQFRDTGVILKVTPRVNEGGLVLLDVSQEVSDVAPTTTSNIDSPTIQQRKVSSTIVIQDGETVALGGLIRDTRRVGKSGIPVMQDIPVLGALFGSRTNDVRRTELLIMITPRVVRNSMEARDITEELRRRVRATAPLDERTR